MRYPTCHRPKLVVSGGFLAVYRMRVAYNDPNIGRAILGPAAHVGPRYMTTV